MVGTAIAILLAASFGLAPVVRSMIPSEGLVMYRAEGFGFFNGAGRSFLAPPGAPWSYYLANVAGPWIAYTIILAIIALIIAPLALKGLGAAEQTDRTPEIVLSCLFYICRSFFSSSAINFHGYTISTSRCSV